MISAILYHSNIGKTFFFTYPSPVGSDLNLSCSF